MEALKEFLSPKTVNRFSYMANICWIGVGIVLSSIFLDMEMNESRSDFRCGANSDNDLIQGKCFEQYEKQYNKVGIPVYGFVSFNFFVTAIVVGIYSQCIKSRIEELETCNVDVERLAQLGNPTRRKLFKAYCCQLATRFFLGILFIILQTEVLYVSNFPSSFNCSLKRDGNILNITTTSHASGNITEKQTYECHNQRANKKTFWTDAVIVVTGFFAFLVFIEVIWILSRARRGRTFMEDSQFLADHLKSNFLPLQEQQHELKESQQLHALIKDMKDRVIKGTERLRDFASPFQRNPGEGDKQPQHLKLDQIYTNLIIYSGRANYDFPRDREEQLKQYPKRNANLPPTRPQDIIDAQHKNILVVGRPGIGKTIFCTKVLLDWASNIVFNEARNSQLHFEAAFLVKFRRFNSAVDLSLRELLARAEFSTPLNNEFWNHIVNNPTKVLLVFDGIDEFNAKEKIANDDDSNFSDTVDEKMPLHALYNKIATGKLLDGATVLTTTRPTAVSCVKHINFNKTVEILGFSSQQVQDYVKKFTKDGAVGETIWQHISSNLNILSLCYVPMNCFIICMCLLRIPKKSTFPSLPTKLTVIYSIAIKMFVFKHNDKYRNLEEFIHIPFNKLPEDVKRNLKTLGKIAFNGIKEGRLIFASDKSFKKLEDCGLLHRLPDLKTSLQHALEKPRAQFCFIHLTIQEFLAAKYVTDTMKGARLQEFIYGHIKEGTWQLVMQFAAGLLAIAGRNKSIDIFTDHLPVSTAEIKEHKLMDGFHCIEDSESRPLTCWPAEKDKPLALALCKCFQEVNLNDSIVQNKLSKIGFNAIDFSNCKVGPVELTALVNCLKSHKVLCLNLKMNNIGSLDCIEIVTVKVLKEVITQSDGKLNSLNLGHNKITDEDVKVLVEALTDSNCKLNSLNLSHNSISHEAFKKLFEALMDSNCKLSSLNLGHNQITDEDVKFLVEALIHGDCKLNSLNLSHNSITFGAFKHLFLALTNTKCKLNRLNLSGNNMALNDYTYLFKALAHSNCKLSNLDLSGNTVTKDKIELLLKALTQRNCKLNTLNLSSNHINQDDVNVLVEALTNSNCKLRKLDLSDNALNGKKLELLLKALKNSYCKLNSLNLSSNSITHEDVKLLVEALEHSNCKLSKLDLSDNSITHEDVKLLDEACRKINCTLKL